MSPPIVPSGNMVGAAMPGIVAVNCCTSLSKTGLVMFWKFNVRGMASVYHRRESDRIPLMEDLRRMVQLCIRVPVAYHAKLAEEARKLPHIRIADDQKS